MGFSSNSSQTESVHSSFFHDNQDHHEHESECDRNEEETKVSQASRSSINEKHVPSLKCLITCTNWVLDILDNSEEAQEVLIASCHEHSIRFKQCTSTDQQDLLDDMQD